MKSLFFLSWVLSVTFTVLSAGILDFEDSIPFSTVLTRDYQPEGASEAIPSGARLIIIRPINDEIVLADFPRKGIFQVPVDCTSINIQMEELGAAVERPMMPRMAYFLGNRIISGDSGWQYPIRLEVINRFTRWVLIYGDSEEAATVDALTHADEYYRGLSDEERTLTAVVYIDPNGNKEGIQSIADALQPVIHSMPGYLAKGYSRTFRHVLPTDQLPLLVDVKSSGRVIEKISGVAAIEDFFYQSSGNPNSSM